ncbi:MAG: choice-of-anchor M domain-containing protein [Akkermansiaceae bacterium]|nr:choice-of-anchor M domain-containing protein [Akkermansiaceae bacterium]
MPIARVLLSFAFLCPLVTASTPPTDLVTGHYEIHLDYTPGTADPDDGWKFSVSYDEDDDFSTSAGVVRMEPEAVTMLMGPAAARVVPNPAGVFSRFGPSGTPLWVLPQTQVDGALFLGVRTTMAAGLFQARVGGNYTPSSHGSVSLRLVSGEGTGPDAGGKFATWKVEGFGQAVFSFDTTDGITAADEIPTIPVSSHTHYNWGFTRPGLYRVTFEASGKLMPNHGNMVTTARKTFTFSVPFSSAVGGGGILQVVEADGAPLLLLGDAAAGAAYRTDRAMLEARTPAGAASAALAGAVWESRVTLASSARAFPNGVGIAPAIASAGLPPASWSGTALEISGIHGPGDAAWLDGGTIIADKAGGVVPVPSAGRELTLAFTQKGIYRVEGRVRADRAGAGNFSPPFSLVIGAGLGLDFTYADWSASHEAQAGLAAGALSEPMSDHDHDGIPNGVEFALFWHGLDPTRADGGRMPSARRTADGGGAFTFLRDTYKDPLAGGGWSIRPAVSHDLVRWTVRSATVPGPPLGLFETGAEEGNAHGRIWSRSLRLIPSSAGAPPATFFRLHVTAP